MAMDLQKMIIDIAKVGAQKYAPLAEPVPCEDCGQPATETRTVAQAPFARHYCAGCAADRRP